MSYYGYYINILEYVVTLWCDNIMYSYISVCCNH